MKTGVYKHFKGDIYGITVSECTLDAETLKKIYEAPGHDGIGPDLKMSKLSTGFVECNRCGYFLLFWTNPKRRHLIWHRLTCWWRRRRRGK